MTDAPRPDTIARCLLQSDSLRVVAVTTSALSADIARRHEATGGLAIGLSRTASAGLLLASLTKNQESVTLQVMTQSPLGGITVDANSSGRVRAYPRRSSGDQSSFTAGRRNKLSPLIGTTGLISVVRDLGLKENFSGQTPLVSGEIDQDVEHYLCTSEQIDSALVCDAAIDEAGNIVHAGGVLVQAMPDSAHSDLLKKLRETLHGDAFVSALASAATPDGLARIALGDVAEDLRVLEQRPVHFGCPCSRERAQTTLSMLGQADLNAMLADPGHAEVTCEFCKSQYVFSDDDLATIAASLNDAKPS